jgi:cell division protein FtsB
MVGALVFVAFLYYKPLTTFLDTREQLAARRAEVVELRDERQRLEARLARSATTDVVAREARRIGYVRPGERLFIVKGIPEWRRERRATIERDG